MVKQNCSNFRTVTIIVKESQNFYCLCKCFIKQMFNSVYLNAHYISDDNMFCSVDKASLWFSPGEICVYAL